MVYLSLNVFELFSWLQKRLRPPVRRPGYDDKYRSRSSRFVERQKCIEVETLETKNERSRVKLRLEKDKGYIVEGDHTSSQVCTETIEFEFCNETFFFLNKINIAVSNASHV